MQAPLHYYYENGMHYPHSPASSFFRTTSYPTSSQAIASIKGLHPKKILNKKTFLLVAFKIKNPPMRQTNHYYFWYGVFLN